MKRAIRTWILGALVASAAPSLARADQFVLFDVTFTFTKADADNSKPSKSHYYVKGAAINPDRPKDWTRPVDFRNGRVHIRTEVIEKPDGGAPTTWTMCYIPNKGQGDGYGCTGSDVYREVGVYEKDVSMKSFWQNEAILWSEGIKQMDLVIKDDSGGSGHAHKRKDHEKFFPTRMRITMVQVSAGSKYDPTLVPNLPPSKPVEVKPEAIKEAPKCCGADLAEADDPSAPRTLDLWPGEAPGEVGKIGEEKSEQRDGITIVSNVSKPTIAIYRPSPEKDTGASVVICPGGGYNILATSHEGEDVARWLNTLGVTGIVLKYRIPRREGTPNNAKPPQALMDAQRAMGLVRSKAAEIGIDPRRIGLLGFSAGGHLAAWASTNFDKRSYEPVDEADKVDCRPDFTVLIYPAYLVNDPKAALSEEIRPGSRTPPTFLAHAGDDPVTVESSVQFYLALKKAGVPAELHVYSSGGHGYGMQARGKPVNAWPQRLEEWMKSQGLLKAPAKP